MTRQSERQDHWQRAYGDKATDQVSWYQTHPAVSLALIDAAGLPREAPLIDIGGGASTLVDHLLAAGYRDLTVLDVAGAALAAARKRLDDPDRVHWIAADITRWTPPRRYALWHDRAVFHFLTDESDRRAYVHALDVALADDGQVVIATFAPDGPERCSGLPVVRYDEAEMGAALGPGWRLIESRGESHLTPADRRQAFLYFRFARA